MAVSVEETDTEKNQISRPKFKRFDYEAFVHRI